MCPMMLAQASQNVRKMESYLLSEGSRARHMFIEAEAVFSMVLQAEQARGESLGTIVMAFSCVGVVTARVKY